MVKFLVKWEIDIDAANEWEAAEEAHRIQQDPKSIATFYTVTERYRKNKTYIDLYMQQVN